MSKSIHFFSHTVFGQLISLVDRNLVSKAVFKTQADRFCKGFHTWDHLVSMLFCSLSQCTSLREVVAGCLGLKGKAEHLGLKHLPRRSTLADANKARTSEVFASVYYSLFKKYHQFITDSRVKIPVDKEVLIFDSTTISLFKNILKCVGAKSKNGKQKGGIKAHMMINANESVPQLIWFSAAATHDVRFLEKIAFKKDAIYVFDKGYPDYRRYEALTKMGSHFVTRLRDNATYETLKELQIAEHIDPGVIKDEIIQIPIRKKGSASILRKVTVRRIAYWNEVNQTILVFLTNMLDVPPDQISELYKKRWQIELLFKNLKQNFPLKYFLGDNENAIIIQIWSALIANLLLTVLSKKITRTWAFSNLASFVRIHLFNYIHLIRFLNNPEKDWIKEIPTEQLDMFSP
jgi:hypothetical protein